MIASIVIILFSIVLSALFSGLETGTYTVNKIRIHHNIQEKRKRALLLSNNLKDPQTFIFMTLIGNNISVYLATGSVTDLFSQYNLAGSELVFLYGFIPWSAEIAATATLMLPLFIFAEVGPKNLFRIKADILMYDTAAIQRALLCACRPVTKPLGVLVKFLTQSGKHDYSHGIRNINLQRLRLFLKESRDEGTINDRQSRMIDNTLMLQKKTTTDVMVPISDIVSLEKSEVTVENCITIFKNRAINRIPIYEGSIFNITSYMDVIDVMSASTNKEPNLTKSIRDIFWIYAQNDLQQAFYQMQSNGEKVAAVKDTNDNVIGLIHIKDIIRTITGSR